MTDHLWRPSPAALSAETHDETLRTHPTVAIHFWAAWNKTYDRVLDESLSTLYGEFGDRIAFRSVDSDDQRFWAFMGAAGIINLPAIGFWKGGNKERVEMGMRSPTAWRKIIMEVLAGARDGE